MNGWKKFMKGGKKRGQTPAGDLRCMSKAALKLEVVSRLYDFLFDLMIGCLVLVGFCLGVWGLCVEVLF